MKIRSRSFALLLAIAITICYAAFPKESTLSPLVDAASKLPAPAKYSYSVTKNSITLSWNAVSGADAYKIYMYNTKTKKYEKYISVAGTSWNITGLSANQTYYFKVSTLDKGTKGYIEGNKSGQISIKTSKTVKSTGADFRKSYWGQTVSSVKPTESSFVDLSGYGTEGLYLGSSPTLGDYKYLTFYYFDSKNKLYEGVYILDDDARNVYDEYSVYLAYKQLISLYTEKYGEPIKSGINYYYDSSSSTLSVWELVEIGWASGTAFWETDTTKITINYMEDDDATPMLSVHYTSKNYTPVNNKKAYDTSGI